MSLYLNDEAFQITFETLRIINSILMERKKIFWDGDGRNFSGLREGDQCGQFNVKLWQVLYPSQHSKPALNLERPFPLQNLQHLRGVRALRSSLKRRAHARLAEWSLAFPFARSRPSQISCQIFCSSDLSVTFPVFLNFMKEYLIFYFDFPASHLRGVYPCHTLKFEKKRIILFQEFAPRKLLRFLRSSSSC
jgi:hypothetical protein